MGILDYVLERDMYQSLTDGPVIENLLLMKMVNGYLFTQLEAVICVLLAFVMTRILTCSLKGRLCQ